ncbi:MAG: alpha/beta fold hydrolase [Novosphingobium sp.]
MTWLRRTLIALIVLLVGAFLALRTPDTDPAAMRAKYGSAPSQFVDLGNGLKVHLRDEGPRDAPVIVLLHGSNDDLHTWDPWAAQLSRSYRVIRFDQIGHGLTGPAPNGDYSPAAFVDTIDRVTAKLGVTSFVLAGNSMGGANALHYALAHGDKVRMLVLLDAGGGPQFNKEPGNIGFKIARTPVVNKLMLSVTPRFVIEKSLHQSVWNQAVVTPAMVDRFWEMLRYPGNRQATLDRFSGGWFTFDPKQLGTLKMPVLIMWGAHDSLIAPTTAQWFASAIPHSEVIMYPDSGHMPQQEVADRSAEDLEVRLAALQVIDAASGASAAAQ